MSRVRGRAELAAWLPPVVRREFWSVQALVLVIAGGHSLLETAGRNIEPQALYLVPTSFFFIPVVYAALNFGVRGSLPTALWSAILTIPNLILWHQGLERVAVVWQAIVLIAVAVFVGQRVDRERAARRDAEDRERARRASEERYRTLFDHAAEAVLVVSENGLVEEVNQAAADLMGRPIEACLRAPLPMLVGDGLATELMSGVGRGRVMPLPGGGPDRAVWVEPINCGPLREPGGASHLQTMLHDVTLQHERQEGLEEYARWMLTARDDEQRRIARELHDGPLQALIVVWRRLDGLGNAALPSSVAGEVAQTRDLAEQTADELRRITHTLRSPVLDNLGLLAALRAQTATVAQRAGLSARCASVGRPVRLESEVEFALFRIAQEALHNVERHSGATKVLVRLSFRTNSVRLLVRDNGKGLPTEVSASDLLRAGKFGLVGMQERARLIRGTIHIGNGQNVGMSVEVIVPTLT